MQQRPGRGPQAETQLKAGRGRYDPQVMVVLWGTGGSQEVDGLMEG